MSISDWSPSERARLFDELLGIGGAVEATAPGDAQASDKPPWFSHADSAELMSLVRLDRWIALKEENLADLRADRAKIMNRCIRRMRRSEGKQ